MIGFGKLGAHGDHQIRLSEEFLGGTLAEGRTQALRMIIGDRASARDRGNENRPRFLDKGPECRTGIDGAPAGDNHRSPGGTDQFRRCGERAGFGDGTFAPPAGVDRGNAGTGEHVERDLDMNRARPARLEDGIGVGHGLG